MLGRRIESSSYCKGKQLKLLITGGAGFIGSSMIRQCLARMPYHILNIDKLTYASSSKSLKEFESNLNYQFSCTDINDQRSLRTLFTNFKPTVVVHFAAETHVDRSITRASDFVQSNIVGTFSLLETASAYFSDLSAEEKQHFRFLHISTDEVYGDLGSDGYFLETSPLAPNSPYSATKASSDLLVNAWYRTYGLPIIITHCSNNYGPYQFPEKLIPLMILNALENKALPVYGKGLNIRDWIYVEDHTNALLRILERGRIGQTYNIGANSEHSNLEIVYNICDLIDSLVPHPEQISRRSLVKFVQDRPGHDFRYAIDNTKVRTEFDWQPNESFSSGLAKTIKWYMENADGWCRHILDQSQSKTIFKNREMKDSDVYSNEHSHEQTQ